MGAAMTIAIDASICPSVFDAGLPSVDYEHCESPDEAHDIISAARCQAPIAIGPHGPEVPPAATSIERTTSANRTVTCF
jgi:hypothetical protein